MLKKNVRDSDILSFGWLLIASRLSICDTVYTPMGNYGTMPSSNVILLGKAGKVGLVWIF